jgi:hypothetical protein
MLRGTAGARAEPRTMTDFEPTGSAPRLSELTVVLDPAPSAVFSWGGVR